MTKAQTRIAFNWLLIAILLIIFSVFDDWIMEHWESLKWLIFLVLIIIGTLHKKIPTYTERHFEFNQLIEENPWLKVFYGFYLLGIVAGNYYIMSHGINIVKEVGIFGLFGAVLLLILPVYIIRQKELYIEAGKENS